MKKVLLLPGRLMNERLRQWLAVLERDKTGGRIIHLDTNYRVPSNFTATGTAPHTVKSKLKKWTW